MDRLRVGIGVLVAAAAGVGLAGCGDDGDTSAADTTARVETTTTEPTTTTSAPTTTTRPTTTTVPEGGEWEFHLVTDDGWEYDGSASSTIEYAFEVAIEDSPPGQARLLMTVTGDAGVNLVGATPGRNTPPLEEAPLGAHHAVFGSGTSGVPTSTLPCEFSVAGGDAVSDYGVLCSVRDTGTFESGDTDEAALRAALPVLNSGPIFLAFDIGTGGGGCRVLLFPDGSVKLAFEQSQCTLT